MSGFGGPGSISIPAGWTGWGGWRSSTTCTESRDMGDDRPAEAPPRSPTLRPGLIEATPTRSFAQPPELTLRTYALGAVATLAYGRGAPAKDTAEARFLLGQLAAVAPAGTAWETTLPAYL